MNMTVKLCGHQRGVVSYDDEEILVFSPKIIPMRRIEAMTVSSIEQARQALQTLERAGALRYILCLLSKRSLHSQQINDRLLQHAVHADTIGYVIEYCRAAGYVNDDDWIEHAVAKWQSLGKSALDVQHRLREQHLSSDGTYDEQQALAVVCRKKYPILLQAAASVELKQKAIRALLRRGFSFSSVQKFLQNN